MESSCGAVAEVGGEVRDGGGDGAGEGRLPRKDVWVVGLVVVVVDIRREEVVSGGDGTAAEQEGLGVAVHMALFELLWVLSESG